MKITKLAPIGVALLLTAYLHGANPPVDLAPIDLSKIDPHTCSSIKFSFKIWHEDEFKKKEFAKIVEQFDNLVKMCKQTDKDGTGFDPIVKILGKPFDSIFEKVMGKEGFSVSLIVNVNSKDDKTPEDLITLDCTLSHEKKYDKDIWQAVIANGVDFFGQEQWIQKLAPLFTDVINTKDAGIHGSLNISAG